MPVTRQEPVPEGRLQRFRTVTEGYLLQVAQRAMLRQHPSVGSPPAPKRGFIYRILPVVFLPGFLLTPWFIKRRLLSWFFVRSPQKWPERPWEGK